MPKENKKRGRRGEAQKRKWDDTEDAVESPFKRRRTFDGVFGDDNDAAHTNNDAATDLEHSAEERPFYGLLDEHEQEYFKRADNLLEANEFPDVDDRTLFLDSVFKEAEGKELKLACSQSCSRLLERLILLSSTEQQRNLFRKFDGHFLNLVQHRFASHCCETLFVQSAPAVTEELLTSAKPEADAGGEEPNAPSMESLFLGVVGELENNFGFLMTHKFASHAFRVLLLVLSGQPIDLNSRRSLLRSSKKEDIEVLWQSKVRESVLDPRTVSDSFKDALWKIIDESVLRMDTNHLRALATHQTANPTLQLLLKLELTLFGKKRGKEEDSVLRKLLPDDPLTGASESGSFVNGLVYDPVGSRLLETIIENAPGKMFKTIYKEFFSHKLGSLARNEVASYVVCKVLERLSADDLRAALEVIIPQIPTLTDMGQTSTIRTLMQRCVVRDLDASPLATALQNAYTDDEGTTFSLVKMLELPVELQLLAEPTSSQPTSSQPTSGQNSPFSEPNRQPTSTSSAPPVPMSTPTPPPSTKAVHASLLAQSMLQHDGPLSTLVFNALTRLPAAGIHHLALTPQFAPILSTSLTVPHAPLIFRRKLITRFYGSIAPLSLHPSASRVIDAIWTGTAQGLAFARERVAEELAEEEASLRASKYGRAVWRNWCMDLYKRRAGDWVRMVRREAGNIGFQSFPDGHATPSSAATSERGRSAKSSKSRASTALSADGQASSKAASPQTDRPKTALDLARERHAAKRQRRGPDGSEPTGSTNIDVSRSSGPSVDEATGDRPAPGLE